MSSQTITVDVSHNQLIVEILPQEILQLEAEISVVSPGQISLLEEIRNDSEAARDRSIEAEDASGLSSINAANSENQALDYRDKTQQLHDDTDNLYTQTDQLHSQTKDLRDNTQSIHDATDQLRQQTSDLHDSTNQLHNQTSELHDNTELLEQQAADSARASSTSALSSADSAEQSEQSRQASDSSAAAARASETNSKDSETAAASSAQSSSASADESSGSAENAAESQSQALASETAAKTSETNASASETAASSSASEAANSETAAKTSETNASESETAASESETNAASSAAQAGEHRSEAEAAQAISESASDMSRRWATEAEDVPVQGNEYSSLHWAKIAERFASTLTNGMYFAGQWDFADGFPDDPTEPQVPWYRIVGTDVSGVVPLSDSLRELAEQSNNGDQLIWDPIANEWFVIDTSDEVWMVNGKIGNVELDAGDVGAYSLSGGEIQGFINITGQSDRQIRISSNTAIGYTGELVVTGAGVYIRKRNDDNSPHRSIGINPDGEASYYDGIWRKIYHENYKPTTDDIGALSVTGGTLQGNLIIPNSNHVLSLRNINGLESSNLHINAQNGRSLYLNWYSGESVIFGDGSENTVVRISKSGSMSVSGLITAESGILPLYSIPESEPEASARDYPGGLSLSTLTNGQNNGWPTDHTTVVTFKAHATDTTRMFQLLGDINSRRLYWRSAHNNSDDPGYWKTFQKIYHEGEKPTASDVGLGNLPNAKTDDPTADDSDQLATSKATAALDEIKLDKDAKAADSENLIGIDGRFFVKGENTRCVNLQNNFNDAIHSGFYRANGNDSENGPINNPSGSWFWYITTTHSAEKYGSQIAFENADSTRMWIRSRRSDGTGGWTQVYTHRHRPSADDVGATPTGYGIGQTVLNSTSDVNNLITEGTGLFRATTGTPNNPMDDAGHAIINIDYNNSTNHCLQLSIRQSATPLIYVRSHNSNGWTDWTELYSEVNKPTAADVGALANKGERNTVVQLDTNLEGESYTSRGINVITENGAVHIGADNTFCHYVVETEKIINGHWFNHTLSVRGEIYAGSDWRQKVYHEGNKPTASDIGAASSNHNHDNDYAAKSHTHSQYAIPPGIVTMFAGTEAQVPDGWQLCNGSGETSNGIKVPDMRDRFIVGAGSTYDPGQTGGSASATSNSSGSHDHDVDVDDHILTVNQMPSHDHDYTAFGSFDANGDWDGGANWNIYNARRYGTPTITVDKAGSSGAHSHGATAKSSGAHTHTVNTLPPYYVMAYIIKL